MKIKNAVLLISFVLMLHLSSFNVSAECSLKQEEFEWDDKYYELIKKANYSNEFKDYNMHLTKSRLISSDYIKIYAMDGDIRLNEYKQGDIKDFIKSNSEDSWEEFHYTENGYTAFLDYRNDGPNLNNCQPSYEYAIISIKAIENQADNYCSNGDVTVVRTGTTLNFWAIISNNGVPQYVVILDSFSHDPIYCYDDDSANDRIVKNIYSDLYKKGQRVFDFDFMQDFITACRDTLPDNTVYTPKGLQTGLKNSVLKINESYFYFNKDGICTGKYTGYARKKNSSTVYCKDGIVQN